MSQTPDGLKIYSFSGAGLLVLASEHNKAIAALEQQNAELLAACISAKNTMLASVDNSYAMADTIELLESTIAKAGRRQ